MQEAQGGELASASQPLADASLARELVQLRAAPVESADEALRMPASPAAEGLLPQAEQPAPVVEQQPG